MGWNIFFFTLNSRDVDKLDETSLMLNLPYMYTILLNMAISGGGVDKNIKSRRKKIIIY